MTDQEQLWLEAARAGDRTAFGQLVEAYQRPVFNLTYRMLGDAEEAADAAQEAFLRAYTRLHQYDPQHKFSTWLFSIANHHCIDRLRKRRATVVPIDDTPLVFSLESETPRPEEHLLARERSNELQALLNELEPDYRTPLILRYWHEYSYQEIAETMQISLAAVKSRLFRARQKLAEFYEQSQATALPVDAVPATAGRPAQRSATPLQFSTVYSA
ncbi:MAG: sigma-70 family RNA polymerase sigma factor [Caldilineaceae bacterium]